MTDPQGVNLLPASGEWVYDTVPHRTRQLTQTAPVVQNLYAAPGGTLCSARVSSLDAGSRAASLAC